MYYYKSQRDDTALIEALQDLAYKHPTYGFRKLFVYIRRSENEWNHKKVYWLYELLKLNRKRKGKRRMPSRVKQPFVKQEQINQNWSMDFIIDSMVNGRRFRTFNLIDDCKREVLAMKSTHPYHLNVSSESWKELFWKVVNQASLEQTTDQSSHQKSLSFG
jgi:putative transposase